MTLFLIGLITVLNLFLHFFKLGAIPLFSNSFPANTLIETALISIFSSFLIYIVSKLLFRKNKISLLSFFVFSVIPSAFETGRNGLYINFTLFFVLLLILILLILKKNSYPPFVLNVLRPVLFVIGMLTTLFVLKKPDFIFSINLSSYSISQVLSNAFHLVSPGFLFFSNDSFWNGGNRENGILLLSFLPFLIMGIGEVFRKDFPIMVMLLISGILLSVLNPYFPESFEFYSVTPIFVFSIAIGLYYLRSFNKGIISFFILLFIFEYSLFLHTYVVHYPQNTRNYFQNLEKPI